jgi:redox-sensing transcriptional repressor
VRKVDLSIELQILAFHEQRKAGEEAAAASDGAGPVAASRDAASADKGPDGDVPAVMPA